MASISPSAAITSAPPKKLAVYGLGQFGFAMTALFSAKHASIPVEAYDPVTVRIAMLVFSTFTQCLPINKFEQGLKAHAAPRKSESPSSSLQSRLSTTDTPFLTTKLHFTGICHSYSEDPLSSSLPQGRQARLQCCAHRTERRPSQGCHSRTSLDFESILQA